MKQVVCIVCPKGCMISEWPDGEIKGAKCERGMEYAKAELLNPVRTVTSTVRMSGSELPRLPVKTSAPIPKSMVMPAMKELTKVDVKAPVKAGDVVLKNVCGTGVDIIASKTQRD